MRRGNEKQLIATPYPRMLDAQGLRFFLSFRDERTLLLLCARKWRLLPLKPRNQINFDRL